MNRLHRNNPGMAQVELRSSSQKASYLNMFFFEIFFNRKKSNSAQKGALSSANAFLSQNYDKSEKSTVRITQCVWINSILRVLFPVKRDVAYVSRISRSNLICSGFNNGGQFPNLVVHFYEPLIISDSFMISFEI